MNSAFKFHHKQNRYVPAQTMSELLAAQKANQQRLAEAEAEAGAEAEKDKPAKLPASSVTPVIHTDVSAGQSTVTPSTGPAT